MIQAGKLRHRIDIQTPVHTQDPVTGANIKTWQTTHQSVPASVEPLSVKEFLQSKAEQSETSVRMMIRYREGLTADMRIVYRGKYYDPQGFLTDRESGREYITIPCSEGVDDG
jgi:SPP1 family predicted phage head-tail adaptor